MRSAMSYIPMHNRLVEGFVESDRSGETLDPLSSRILPTRLPVSDFVEASQHTRRARDAALGAALIRVGWFFGAVIARPARSLIERFAAWRRRERAAVEL